MSETLRNIRHDIPSDIATVSVEKNIAEAERLPQIEHWLKTGGF